MNEYNKQALDFLNKAGARMTITKVGYEVNKLWDEDCLRPKYRVTIRRKGGYKPWVFTFWGNLVDSKITDYDVLSCLQKYEVSEYTEDFAREYGYDYNSYENSKETRRMKRIHQAVQREYEHVENMFGDVLDELREIW